MREALINKLLDQLEEAGQLTKIIAGLLRLTWQINQLISRLEQAQDRHYTHGRGGGTDMSPPQ